LDGIDWGCTVLDEERRGGDEARRGKNTVDIVRGVMHDAIFCQPVLI